MSISDNEYNYNGRNLNMEDIKTNTLKRKWDDDDGTIKLHGSIGREFIITKERLALLKMCEKAKKKAGKTKKYKGIINKNNTKTDSDFVNNADKNGV